MRIRTYEKPIVVAAVVLVAALAVLLPAARQDSDAYRATAHPNEHASNEHASNEHAPATSTRTDEAANRQAGPGALCPDAKGARSIQGGGVAVAADHAGRFAFYGLADPKTGLVGDDSHELLRGCAENDSPSNPVRAAVGGEPPRILGPDNVLTPTREEGSSLVTRYALPGGLSVTQTLTLVRVGGRPDTPEAADTLRVSYRLQNRSQTPAPVSLSAALSPAKGPFSDQMSGVPYFANHPADGPGPIGAVAVRTQSVLKASRGELPKEIIVPRPGAAASSTCYWRPLGDPPERIAFGPAAGFARTSTPPATERGDKLPHSSAFAASWDAPAVPPGAARALAYDYGTASGWPR